MTYQKVTGTLNPGAHPGSYNRQDAYNDMLVTDESLLHWKRSSESVAIERNSRSVELYERSDETAVLHRGGAKRLKHLMRVITRRQEPETERSVRFWLWSQTI